MNDKKYITITKYDDFYAVEYIHPDVAFTLKAYTDKKQAQNLHSKLMQMDDKELTESLYI